MSIYSTQLWFQLPARGISRGKSTSWVTVVGQAVPGHIGHPDEYPDGDPYLWLPPSPEDPDELRAMVFVLEGTAQEKCGQRYANPLLTLSGRDYKTTPFPEVLEKLTQALYLRGPCPTCGKRYNNRKPNFCSAGYHACRDCTWEGGRQILSCAYHQETDPLVP